MGRGRDSRRLAERTDAAAGGSVFNAISPKALAASGSARLPRSFWAWDEIVAMNKDGYFPYTPNTNLLYALSESIDMLLGEGLDNVFARHARWGAGVRAAVNTWGIADPVRRPQGVFARVDRCPHARGHGRRRPEAFDLRALRSVPGNRTE